MRTSYGSSEGGQEPMVPSGLLVQSLTAIVGHN